MTAGIPKKVIHGGSGKQKQEKTRKKVLDFSASVNPYPPDIEWDCDPFFLTHYPDDSYSRLKEVIAETFRRTPDEICVGNGSIELIRACCRVILAGKGRYYTEDPTFGEYAYSARLYGGIRTRSMEEADLTFICNPNNPDGSLRSRDEMSNILSRCTRTGSVFCADEAFIELADPDQSLVSHPCDNLLVLRSLTKCFSVPGLRFGYGFGSTDLVGQIEAARLPWTVNAYAEAFALRAFTKYQELSRSRRLIAREREYLVTSLSRLGLSCAPSSANYILIETGEPVHQLCINLEKQGILVRNCTSFGLKTKIRVAVLRHEENRILVEALSACLP